MFSFFPPNVAPGSASPSINRSGGFGFPEFMKRILMSTSNYVICELIISQLDTSVTLSLPLPVQLTPDYFHFIISTIYISGALLSSFKKKQLIILMKYK